MRDRDAALRLRSLTLDLIDCERVETAQHSYMPVTFAEMVARLSKFLATRVPEIEGKDGLEFFPSLEELSLTGFASFNWRLSSAVLLI